MNQIQANIRVLSDDEIVRIHNTSMRILSEIGLHVPNETVCGMAQKLGAKVDGETVRKISGNVSTQIFVFDEQTGTRRQGIVGADQGFSFAQLVLDDAWLDAFNYTLQGFTVDEDTLGFETIEEVGIGGNFLSEWHTVEYMRSSWWKHDLFPRQTFQDGEPIQTAWQRAQERAQTIIAENHTDEPVIDGAQCAMLDKIVQDALDHLDA